MNVKAIYELSEQSPSNLAKNEATAQRIAAIFGGKVVSAADTTEGAVIGFPYDAVVRGSYQQDLLGPHDDANLYGSIVDVRQHGDKAMLHPRLTDKSAKQSWHDDEFALRCQPLTLPGFTVFSKDDVTEAAKQLQKYNLPVLIKDPSASCGNRQILYEKTIYPPTIESIDQTIETDGLVVETAIPERDRYTLVAGTVALKGTQISWIGRSWGVFHHGEQRIRFGGSTLRAVEGDFNELAKVCQSTVVKEALSKCSILHTLYPTINALVNRATYDIVGSTKNPELMGVVDPSLRPSASSPGEIVAYETLVGSSHPKADVSTRYIYKGSDPTVGAREDIFVKTPDVTIVTEVH